MKKTKIVYWAENQVEADLISAMFKEYGIHAQQLQESAGKTIGIQFGLLGQIAIAVDEEQTAEAEALLLDMDVPVDDEEEKS